VVLVILPKIRQSDVNNKELYQGWKEEMKFFTLSSLQVNLRFLLIINIKIFSPNSHDVTKFAYIFGIVGFIYIVRKLCKQNSQSDIAKYIASNSYQDLKKYIIKFISINICLVSIIVVVLILLHPIYLKHFALTKYYNLMLLLIISGSLITILEPLLSNFLLFYNQNSLKVISTIKIAYFILLGVLSIAIAHYYYLTGVLLLLFGSNLILISLQIIAFIKYFRQFKLAGINL
jgi:hypothetical protein